MEGVFGTNKNFYGLGKIKVKGERREKLMIFFGIMTVNAVLIAKRRKEKESPTRKKLLKKTGKTFSWDRCAHTSKLCPNYLNYYMKLYFSMTILIRKKGQSDVKK